MLGSQPFVVPEECSLPFGVESETSRFRRVRVPAPYTQAGGAAVDQSSSSASGATASTADAGATTGDAATAEAGKAKAKAGEDQKANKDAAKASAADKEAADVTAAAAVADTPASSKDKEVRSLLDATDR